MTALRQKFTKIARCEVAHILNTVPFRIFTALPVILADQDRVSEAELGDRCRDLGDLIGGMGAGVADRHPAYCSTDLVEENFFRGFAASSPELAQPIVSNASARGRAYFDTLSEP